MDKIKKEATEETCAVYRCQIIEMVGEIESLTILKRIYQLTEYLYVHKKE